MGNGFRFEGAIDQHHLPRTNRVLAFTVGDVTKSGFVSDNAVNLQDLVYTLELKAKKERKLVVSLPMHGGDMGVQNFNLNLFDSPAGSKDKPDKFKVFVFDSETKQEANTVIIFHHVKKKGGALPMKWLENFLLPAIEIYTFDWDGTIEVVGQRA